MNEMPPPSSPSYRIATLEEQIIRRISKLEAEVKRLSDAEHHINEHEDRLDGHDIQLSQFGAMLERLANDATTRGMVMDRVDRNLASILEYVKTT